MCFETNCLHQVHELKMEKKKADALTYQMLPPTVARVAINVDVNVNVNVPTVARVAINVNSLPIILNSQDYQKTKNLMARQFESVTIYFWCEAFLGKIIARIGNFSTISISFQRHCRFHGDRGGDFAHRGDFTSHLLKSLMFDN